LDLNKNFPIKKRNAAPEGTAFLKIAKVRELTF